MKIDHDRRTEPRLQVRPLSVEFPDLQPRVRNLSLSGLYIEEPRPFPRGRIVRLKIWLGDQESIVVRTMVRRVDEGAGMSLEFVEINDADRQRLRSFLGPSADSDGVSCPSEPPPALQLHRGSVIARPRRYREPRPTRAALSGAATAV